MYQQSLSHALAALNATDSTLKDIVAGAQPRIDAFRAQIAQGENPAFNGALKVPQATTQALQGWAEKYQHVLVLGLGGSSIGGRLISQFADPAQLDNPRLHFIDHLCPMALHQLLTGLPLAHTAVVAISKSGGTLETTTQLQLVAGAFQALGLPMDDRAIVVTETTDNPLHQWAQQSNVTVLPHHPALSGRYSVFAETGSIPAILKGLDINAIHAGAQTTLREWLAEPYTSAPALGAALQAHAAAQGKSITVLYAYGEPLRILPQWFEQLWAESTGKNGHGTTPFGAVGPASQHSIQQLFLDGPQDKLYTVVIPQTHATGPARASDALSTGTLQQAMGQGTVQALAARGHPVRTITMPAHSTESLGALLMHLMLETVLAAQIWNLNPFENPAAVNESKQQSLQALDALRQAA